MSKNLTFRKLLLKSFYNRNYKEKGGIILSKVSCSVCNTTLDSRTMQNCPDCSGYVCPECTKLYNGYCEECFDESSNDFE